MQYSVSIPNTFSECKQTKSRSISCSTIVNTIYPNARHAYLVRNFISGNFLDIDNYAGVGGEWDINGNQANSVGSGRNPAMGLNGSTFGYGPAALGMQNYKHPNTSANSGQVII